MSTEGNEVIKKLRYLLQNKLSIRDALYYKGVTDVTQKFSTYGDLVKKLSTANIGYSMPQMFSTEFPQNTSVENDGNSETTYMLRYVSTRGDDSYNDGMTWQTSYKSIQRALNDMQYGVIFVEDGEYFLEQNITINSGQRIKIYGGFYRNNHDWSERNPYKYMSVLNANGNAYGIVNRQSMFSVPETLLGLIDGVCVYNGIGEGYSAFKSSVNFCVRNSIAINCKQTTSYQDVSAGFHGTRTNVFQNCLALNCNSQSIAGGFRCNTYDILQNCYALECRAATNGGGFYISSKTTSNYLKNCFASGCYAKNNGGGFYISGATEDFQLNSCAAISCRASKGAGFYNTASSSNYNKIFYKNCVCYNCESDNSIMYVTRANIVNCSVFANKINLETGYPVWMPDANGSKIINLFCCFNYYFAQLKGINIVSSNGIFMRHCVTDVDITTDDIANIPNIVTNVNVSDVNYDNEWSYCKQMLKETDCFVSYMPYYWYQPIGYKVINDFCDGFFGDFHTNKGLVKYGYILQGVTPENDFYGEVRKILQVSETVKFISVGAFN